VEDGYTHTLQYTFLLTQEGLEMPLPAACTFPTTFTLLLHFCISFPTVPFFLPYLH